MSRRLTLLLALACGCSDRLVVADDEAVGSSSDESCTPLDFAGLAGSIGSPCESPCECRIGLDCMDGLCGPCPAGNPGCPCEAGGLCDLDIVCVGGLCR